MIMGCLRRLGAGRVAILASVGLSVVAAFPVWANDGDSIPGTLTSRGDFTTLLAAAEAAGLVETLQSGGPFTLFAPNDAAFAKLPDGTVASLLADPEQLSQILLYHVVPGSVDAATVVTLSGATTVQGSDVTVSTDGGVSINEANVIETDLAASNGIIHVIDSVLLPPGPAAGDIPTELSGRGNFTTLLAAVEAAGLVETLQGSGPFTLFAPNDAAFAKLPEGTVASLLADPEQLSQILLYHVVPGSVDAATVVTLPSATTVQGSDVTVSTDGGVSINEAAVIVTDLVASNGIIHVIDSVLLPPSPALGDIPTELSGRGNFTTLLAAVEAAGLVETLQGAGPFTLFAPNDAAFAMLPEGTVASLLADPEQLSQILLYHVVPGSVDAATVVTLPSATTAQGSDVTITVDGGVAVNESNVIETDILTSNGIIHVIDRVLLPNQGSGPELSIGAVDGGVAVSWVAPEGSRFQLERTSNLDEVSWVPVEAAVQPSPEGSSVVVEATGPSGFFRLVPMP